MRLLDKLHCGEIVCLGDISGFSSPYYRHENERDASACLKLIRENCSIIIPGNHDLYACRKIPSHNPGFEYPDDWYNLDLETREALADNKIWLYENEELESNYSDEDKSFIAGLPEVAIKNIGGMNVLFSHHLYPDVTGSSTRLLPDNKLKYSHLSFMDNNDCQLAFFGHNHVEGIWVISDKRSGIRKKICTGNEPVAIGLPCIVRGKNLPGIAIYNTDSGMVRSRNLEPVFKRLKLYLK